MRNLPDEGEWRRAQPVVMPENWAAAQIEEISNRMGHINRIYSHVHEIEILKSDSAWIAEVDEKLLWAQQRGRLEFQACYHSIQLELNCIQLEARLRKSLFHLISTQTEIQYSSATGIMDSIKHIIDTGNLHFRCDKSLDHNRELVGLLIDKLIVVEGPAGREETLYREILALARTRGSPS
jgi:hypothetical protein